jgi:hypothetical protein
MQEDGVDLSERMRSLTVAELRRTAQNHSGDHDPDEARAARRELTLRFSALHEGPLEEERGAGDDPMPVGLKIVFYLASCVAGLEILALVLIISALVTSNMHVRMLVEAILRYGVPAAWAIWIARTVQSEHRYARGLLLLLLSIAITIRLTRTILALQFTYGNWIVLGVMAAAFCYIAFSRAVRSYYRAVSAVEGT